MNKKSDIVSLVATANGSGTLRFRLVLVMIASYLAMMIFLIHCARTVTQTSVVAADFSPAMIALASCMAVSVILTGFFVFVRHGE